ncbi:ornithine cyclodeaminase family protein [Jeotgalibaca sp. MA1X17-3]|uniref:ornithine cyclodeaminase family protein n=1 Tax=Jeotgalibaca sp. MA1X17-3 TaxID=2908211 RepID=UPI001F2F6468|nr:ornithine cyclodeaminase family protein [Jeotgalibaca sp. MA1X17-3]UJF16142.1 ornithine cyclodeaminase family protein [Jeotgalibaca sp. MA1X17-3]
MQILVLKDHEMKEVLSMREAIQADKDALSLYSKGEVTIPLRTNLNIPEQEGQSLYMPGYAADASALGVKIVSVYPGNIKKGLTSVPATMVLVDTETGQVSSIMDGTYLTQLRTGAVAGAGTDELARKDSSVFTLIGTGGQAETQLEAVLAIRPIKQVYVSDLDMERAKEFANKMTSLYGEKYNTVIEAAPSLEDAVRQSDVITSVTTSPVKTFEGSWVKPGTHINGVGSYTPAMAEIDANILKNAHKIYCDTKDALVESGDFTQAIENGLFNSDDITGELGDLINGKTPGRESEEEITFFKTTGNAVLDIVTAQRIYEAAKKVNIGSILEF